MLESDFYSRWVKPKLGKHTDLCRVENALDGGMPDVAYAAHGVNGWVELKIVRDGKLHFSKWQLPWMSRRGPHCGWDKLWVLAMSESGKVIFLMSARDVLSVNRGYYRKWITVEIAVVPKTYQANASEVDWLGLSYVIAGLKKPVPPD